MPDRTKTDPLPKVMHQLQQLAKTGQRDEFAAYCREIVRKFGKDNEALMRLARFCQKQQWHAGFELFMTRLAERLPQSKPGIYVTIAQELLAQGRRRGLVYLQQACAEVIADGPHNDELLQRALQLAVPYVAARDDWEDAVRKFPEEVQGQLFLDLAERWGEAAPQRAFRAYQRGLHVQPDAWPGDALTVVTLAHARALMATDPAKAMRDLQWASDKTDDPRLESEAAAIAVEMGDKAEALRLSRNVFQRKPDDLDNLGRLAGLQAEMNTWGEVAALAPSIIVAVARLNPWQRDDYAPAVDLALEAWLRTGETAQVEAALQEVGLGDTWQDAWRTRLQREEQS